MNNHERLQEKLRTRRTKGPVTEAIYNQAVRGGPWRELHADLMAELDINPDDIEARLANERNVGMTAFTPDELSKLDDYLNDWIALVNTTGPSLTPLHEREKQIRPLIDTLYKETFGGLSAPEIIFCPSPAKLVAFYKALAVTFLDKDDLSTEQFRSVAEQVVADLAPEEQEPFVTPLVAEYSRLCQEFGAKLRGTSLTDPLFHNVLNRLHAEIKTQSTEILKTDASDFYDEGFWFRFEPVFRRLSTIFKIDFPFELPDSHPASNLHWREQEAIRNSISAFARETWGLWGSYSIVGAGFMMESMTERGRFSRECESQLSNLLTMLRLAPWYSFFKNFCFVGMYPIECHVDEQLRLNNPQGAAALFADGWKSWAVDGIRLPRRMVESPESITVNDIKQAQNVNIRRMMLEMYGTSRYIEDSGSRLVHKDEYGELYYQELPGDEPLLMVCVVNSTMESDGTYRRYFLRVPPHMRTAKEAVAWTFGMQTEEYSPDVQT